MTTLREAAQQALEWFDRNTYGDEAVDVYEALCTALAEQPAEQEPVAWRYKKSGAGWFVSDNEPQYVEQWNDIEEIQPLYTAPQPAKQPLIADEICDSWEFTTGHQIQFGPSSEGRPMYLSTDEVIEFARAIERAHGIGEQE